jgi:hypothetical protein
VAVGRGVEVEERQLPTYWPMDSALHATLPPGLLNLSFHPSWAPCLVCRVKHRTEQHETEQGVVTAISTTRNRA